MTGKKKTRDVAKTADGGASKTPEAKKPAPQPTNQFVSEKTVRLAVAILVIFVVGYFTYPYAKTWVGSFFSEDAALETEAEEPAETPTAIPDEIATEPESGLNSPEILDETPLAIDELPAEEMATPEGEQDGEALTDTPAETVAETPPAEVDIPAIDEARVANLEAEINALKEELAGRAEAPGADTAHFASAVAGLAPPLYQSRTFVGELEQVRILILGMAPLDQATLAEPLGVLSGFSRTGVPDSATLDAAFKDASLQALRDEGLTETSGWWARTWAQIKGLVVVRRTDISDSATLEGAILRMETALGAGDLRAALDVLKTLKPVDAGAFENWAKLAEGRVEALEAFEKLINFIPLQKSGAN